MCGGSPLASAHHRPLSLGIKPSQHTRAQPKQGISRDLVPNFLPLICSWVSPQRQKSCYHCPKTQSVLCKLLQRVYPSMLLPKENSGSRRKKRPSSAGEAPGGTSKKTSYTRAAMIWTSRWGPPFERTKGLCDEPRKLQPIQVLRALYICCNNFQTYLSHSHITF